MKSKSANQMKVILELFLKLLRETQAIIQSVVFVIKLVVTYY